MVRRRGDGTPIAAYVAFFLVPIACVIAAYVTRQPVFIWLALGSLVPGFVLLALAMIADGFGFRLQPEPGDEPVSYAVRWLLRFGYGLGYGGRVIGTYFFLGLTTLYLLGMFALALATQ